jgi:hypothetical protein
MRACDAAKLARVLGLLGSEFPGERASAALAAHRLMKRLGLSWQDVLGPRETARAPREAVPPPAHALEAAESRLRQCRRENGDLQRQIVRMRRRLEVPPGQQPLAEWPD